MGTNARGYFFLVLILIVVAGVALHLPSLGIGFYADDYTHQLVLRGEAMPKPAAWSLYDFGSADDWTLSGGQVEAVPWWTSPDWKVRFFRPLTSATIALDHALWGADPLGYHLTSLAWYALLLLLVPALYRALGLARGTALLAVALFAATSGAVLPAGWISNRNTVIAAVLVVAALIPAVYPGPRGPWRRLRWALPPALLALLAKESGIVGLVLLTIWFLRQASSGDEARRRANRGAAIVCAALAVAFVAVLALSGLGTRSLFYATPWGDPVRYLGNLLVLFTAGPLRLMFPMSLDLGAVLPALVLPACLAGATLAGLLAWRLRGRVGGGTAVLFLLAWVVVCLGVEGGSPPSDRVLLGAAIGSAGLLALFISAALTAAGARARLDRVLALALLITAGPFSAAFTVLQSAAIAGMAREIREAALDLDSTAGDARQLLVLQAESAFVPFSLGATLLAERPRSHRQVRPLQLGRRGLQWSREDERTFILRSLDEPFLTHVVEGVFLSRRPEPSVGDRWRTPEFEAEAVEVDHGLRAIRFRLRRSLDDPELRFLVERDGRLVAVPPPGIGETVELPRAVPANPMVL